MISKLNNNVYSLALISLFTIQLSACDSNSDVDLFVQAEEVAALDLASLGLTTDVALINKGETSQFAVSGQDSNGTDIFDLDSKVSWKTSNSDLARIDDSGLVTALADGVITITASYAYLQASSTLTINTADLVQIDLAGDVMVDECKTIDLTASGIFSDGSTRVIRSGLIWTVSESTVASVESADTDKATLMTHKPGTVSVKATKSSVTGSLNVEVADALLELVISPVQANVSIDSTVTYAATGVYSNTETLDITTSTIWTSVDSDIAAFNTGTNSIITGISEGSTSVVGACGELSTTAVVVVNSVTLDSVAINYSKSSITLDEDDDGYQLTLRATYSDGTVEDVTDDADWSNITSASGNIVVSDDDTDKGELTITGTGSANIEAEYEGKSDTILIIVE